MSTMTKGCQAAVLALALDDADPLHDWVYYSSRKPYPTPSDNFVLLYDKSANGLLMNVVTGALTPFSIDTKAPPGYTLANYPVGWKLVLLGVTDFRVRSLAALP